ncbi:2-dehydro-3-deoxyphosphooctonate aldolase [Roseospira navarrensis]|uniref:2-dehydro-3-deoxyphosphooctonate aldolase n=2 Tax=Roseospira navarrensis TaxID=140058 RepID=A0A7X1ZDE2_9PROT|nr:2-dehydro-3-deoxyphosphooctonate aldolase [Roseospira navarrensis]
MSLGAMDGDSTANAQVPTSARAAQAMARVTPDLKADVAAADLPWGAPVFLRVFKHERVLEAWLETAPGGPFTLFRTWPVCAVSGDLGPKTAEGDGQAPEGFYFVPPGRMNPHSRFHLSFNLGYPNAFEQARGWTGSALMVHGDCVSIGCFAMGKRLLPIGADRNDPINEIWTLMTAAFEHGQPFVRVHALPFRLTPEALAARADHPWAGFWANLAEGSRWFEDTGRPPDVTVRDGRYVFGAD